MALECPSIRHELSEYPLFNVSELLLHRWEHTPDEDKDRLKQCWGYTDCGDCHRSKGFCGWCPMSGTCLPIPNDTFSRMFPLLSPTRHKNICAMGPENFELRTSGLGCQVSTITFLTAIVTIFSTLFGVLVLYGLTTLIKWIVYAVRARKGGYVVYGNGNGEVWIRKPESWGKWWRRLTGRLREDEILEVDEGSRERSWWWWRWARHRTGVMDRAAERRPLLD